MPDQDWLPEIYIAELGVARASGRAGAGSGANLRCRGGRQNFPGLVDDLGGTVN